MVKGTQHPAVRMRLHVLCISTGAFIQNVCFVFFLLPCGFYPLNPEFYYFVGALFWCQLRLFLQLRRFGMLVSGRTPQWERRRGRGCGDASLVAHCNLGAKNGCVSLSLPPTCTEQVDSSEHLCSINSGHLVWWRHTPNSSEITQTLLFMFCSSGHFYSTVFTCSEKKFYSGSGINASKTE